MRIFNFFVITVFLNLSLMDKVFCGPKEEIHNSQSKWKRTAYLKSKSKFFFEEVPDTELELQKSERTTEDPGSINSQPGLAENCEPSGKPLVVRYGLNDDSSSAGMPELNAVETWVDQIVNIGKKLFSIVESGKPVVSLQLRTANALPRGVGCWMDLDSWSMPVSKVFRVVYENDLGGKVVDYKFRVSFLPKGAVNGLGQYIANATVTTASLNVGWGYTFNSEVSIPAIFNQGVAGQPKAGMQMDVHWKVETAINYNEGTKSFYLNGDGQLIQMD